MGFDALEYVIRNDGVTGSSPVCGTNDLGGLLPFTLPLGVLRVGCVECDLPNGATALRGRRIVGAAALALLATQDIVIETNARCVRVRPVPLLLNQPVLPVGFVPLRSFEVDTLKRQRKLL